MAETAISTIQRLHEHRAWVDQNLLAAAEKLDDQQLRRQFEMGQGSIWQSLLHMYAAEYVWLETLQGDENALTPGDVRGKLPGNQLGEGAIHSLAELRERWRVLEQRWGEYLQALATEALDEKVGRVSNAVGGGRRFELRRFDGLMHVCLHAHYTYAQAVNMLRHVGAEKLPEGMLMQLVFREGEGR